MEQNSVELSQCRLRDNILISIKDENGFIAGDESAISELDEGDEDDQLNLPRNLLQSVTQSQRFVDEQSYFMKTVVQNDDEFCKPH